MAISISVYSNSSGNTANINVDFGAELRSSSIDGTSNQIEYFFKMTTGSRDTDGNAYSPRIVGSLSHLALNRTKQAASNSASDYTDIKAMITDYVYDYIYGHASDKFLSGVSYKAPLDI